MALPNIVIQKGQGGLGLTLGNEQMVCGLVAHGVAIAATSTVLGIALQEVAKLTSLKDATDRGITEAYDKANGLLLYYHIKEFFRCNPEGQLYLLLVDRTAAFPTLVDITLPTVNAKKLLRAAGGAIKMLGVVFNPANAYVPVITGGIDSLVTDAVAKAQLLAEEEFNEFRPVHIVIEGRGFIPPVASNVNLRTLASEAPNVSVFIGSDGTNPFRTDLSSTVYSSNVHVKNHAAVGTYLGLITRNAVNVNPGYVAVGDIQDATNFVALNLGTTPYVNMAQADLSALNDKGYNFFVKHTGISGSFANDAHTCSFVTSDYYSIENNRVMNKACDLTRRAILPSLNAPVKVNAKGLIDKTFIASVNDAASSALRTMVALGEISSFDVFIDPNQNILSTSLIRVDIAITPTGTARQIRAFVNFKNPYKA